MSDLDLIRRLAALDAALARGGLRPSDWKRRFGICRKTFTRDLQRLQDLGMRPVYDEVAKTWAYADDRRVFASDLLEPATGHRRSKAWSPTAGEIALLGTAPDNVIAERLAVSEDRVVYQRRLRQIPAYDGPIECPICGIPFTRERPTQKYCSHECSVVAKRKTQRRSNLWRNIRRAKSKLQRRNSSRKS